MARLFVFNPGHEEALRHHTAPSYTPRREVQQMMRDLGRLMLLLCTPQDYVALFDPLGELHFIDYLGKPTSAKHLPPLTLTPWALERHLADLIYKKATKQGVHLTLPPICEPYLRLSHRSSSTRLLQHLESWGWAVEELIPKWLYQGENLPQELAQSLEGFIERGHQRLMTKRPFSSSGRGVMPLPLPVDEATLRQLVGQCRQAGSISLEPWLHIVEDWAVEYYYTAGEVRYVGLSRFDTRDSGGAYEGNRLASEAELRNALIQHIGLEVWEGLLSAHKKFLLSSLGDGYEGYIGIDMCLYDEGGKLRLHPAIEINARCTMGVLAHEAYKRHIAPYTHPETNRMPSYIFRLSYLPEVQAALRLYEAHLGTASAPQPTIPLTIPTEESHYYAYLAPL